MVVQEALSLRVAHRRVRTSFKASPGLALRSGDLPVLVGVSHKVGVRSSAVPAAAGCCWVLIVVLKVLGVELVRHCWAEWRCHAVEAIPVYTLEERVALRREALVWVQLTEVGSITASLSVATMQRCVVRTHIQFRLCAP